MKRKKEKKKPIHFADNHFERTLAEQQQQQRQPLELYLVYTR
jgi:hypothetical protein